MVYYLLHLYLPAKVFHGMTDFLWLHAKAIHEINNLLNINRILVGRGFHNIRLIVEVRVLFTINKRYTAGGIFPIL